MTVVWRSRLLRGIGGLGVLSLAAGTAAAQTVRGTVFDSSTSKPMQAAVELIRQDGSVAIQVVSGSNGRFVVKAPAPDSFLVRVRRIGYVTGQSKPVTLTASTDTTIAVRLAPRPVTLAPVNVSGVRGNAFLEAAGYFRRKQETTGTFLDPDKVEQLATKAKQTADVLDGIPGVTIRSYGGSWALRQPVLTRQMGCAGTIVEMADGTNSPTQWPRIYLDGMPMNLGNQGFDLNTIPATEILAIEIYDSVSETPLQYGGTDSTCGVIVIWTKR